MNLALIIAALILLESGGNPDAVGDCGRAVGVLQIHPEMVAECNRIAGWERWTPADRADPAKSRAMAEAYLEHWAQLVARRIGRNLAPEEIARLWNGGPTGYRKASTDAYARRFLDALAIVEKSG